MGRSCLFIACYLLCILLGCSAQESWPGVDTAAGSGAFAPWTARGGYGPIAGYSGYGGISGFDASRSGTGAGTSVTDGSTEPGLPSFQVCAGDAGPDDDAGADDCLVAGDLQVQVCYKSAVKEWIRPWLKITNTGSNSYPLTGVSLRYYYTVDSGSTVQAFDCWSVASVCGSLQHAFVPVTGRQQADHYLELAFKSGSVPAGGETEDIHIGFHKSDWAVYDGSNDWSDYANTSDYVDAQTIPLYLNHTLIWGVEPPTGQ